VTAKEDVFIARHCMQARCMLL